MIRLQKDIIQSGTVLSSSLPSLVYRQSVVLLELSRMSERLSLTTSSMKDKEYFIERTEVLGRTALDWARALTSNFGDSDYETHVKGKIDGIRLE